MSKSDFLLSIVVPLYNEASGLEQFHTSLIKELDDIAQERYEIIYCNDGSRDNTSILIADWHSKSPKVKQLKLSRNFGKENALTAGISYASGDAILMLDGDGQHPLTLIGKFIKAWQAGNKVVVGVRESNQDEGWFKHIGSWLFYKTFSHLGGQLLPAGSTDYRLIDKSVQQAFLSLKEDKRMTRALIDWLGFSRISIPFSAEPRRDGRPGYSRRKLLTLAANSFVSLSPTPLYAFGYLGMAITLLSFLLGLTVFIEQLILGDPLHWKFSGTAMLGILILFLVGILLLSQGILSLYVSHIHSQSKQRPLYIVDHEESIGIRDSKDA